MWRGNSGKQSVEAMKPSVVVGHSADRTAVRGQLTRDPGPGRRSLLATLIIIWEHSW